MRALGRPLLAFTTALAFGAVGCSPGEAPPPAAPPAPEVQPSPSPSPGAPAVAANVLRFQGIASLGSKPLKDASLKAFDLVSGKELAIVAGGAGNIIAGGAGNIVAGGAGNIVAGGAGNIVAGGAGNIVAGGAGNIIAGGAGNHRVLAQSVQGDRPASALGDHWATAPQRTDLAGAFDCAIVGLKPTQAVRLVARSGNTTLVSLLGGNGFSLGGNIIAGGAGNIIAGGAGNIIAGGAGNIVAGGAGNIVAGGAGNIVAGGAGNIIAGGAGNLRVLQQDGGATAPAAPGAARLDLTLKIGLSPATTVAAKSFEGTVKLQYQLPEALVAEGLERAVDVINEAMARLEADLGANEALAGNLTSLLNEAGDLVGTDQFNQNLQQAGLADRLANLVQESLTRYVQEIVAAGGPARREEFTNLRSVDFPVGPVTLRANGELIFTDAEGKVLSTQVAVSQVESDEPEPAPPILPEDDDPGPFADGQAQGALTVRDGVLRQPAASEALVP